MANLSSLAPATTAVSALSSFTTSAAALANLVLVTPGKVMGYQPNPVIPPNSPSNTAIQPPPSFLFHYEGEQTVSLESDITDHYIEDNTAVQDQISLKPEMITTHGFIGELNDVPPYALQILQSIANTLTVIGAYAPELSETALIAYDEAFLLYQVGANAANAAVSAWSSINGNTGENVIGATGLANGVFNPSTGDIAGNQNKQQTAFQQFYGYWRQRTPFTVQTPWAVFQNMYILRLRAIQEAETNVISDFEITFKMIRVATTAFTNGGLPLLQSGQLASQASPLVNNGTYPPGPSTDFSPSFTPGAPQ